MEKIVHTLAISLFVVCIAAGCHRESTSDRNPKGGNTTTVITAESYENLPATAILVRVDGMEMTKGMFDRIIDLKKKAMMLKSSPKSKLEQNNLQFVDSTMLIGLTNSFPKEVAILRYAEANAIKPDKQEIEACRRGFMSNCGLSGTWEKATKRFTEEEIETAEDRIRVEALQLAVKTDYLEKNRIIVPEEELAMLLDRFADYNRRCALTNAMIYATASNVYSRIATESDFIELAEQYDEDEGRIPSGEWGEYTFHDFQDEPELMRASRQFKPGYVSPPIEADNGLMIVRVNEIVDSLGDPYSQDYIPSPEATFTLSRIFFHLPEFIEEPNRTLFHKQAQSAKDNADFAKFIKSEASRLSVEYPSGTKIFDDKKENLQNKGHMMNQ